MDLTQTMNVPKILPAAFEIFIVEVTDQDKSMPRSSHGVCVHALNEKGDKIRTSLYMLYVYKCTTSCCVRNI